MQKVEKINKNYCTIKRFLVIPATLGEKRVKYLFQRREDQGLQYIVQRLANHLVSVAYPFLQLLNYSNLVQFKLCRMLDNEVIYSIQCSFNKKQNSILLVSYLSWVHQIGFTVYLVTVQPATQCAVQRGARDSSPRRTLAL